MANRRVGHRGGQPPKVVVLLIALLAGVACKPAPSASSAAPVPIYPAVRFQAYDGAPPNFTGMTFQVSSDGNSEFLKLGDTIPKTNIKLSEFDPVTRELIVTNTATNQRARLALPKPVDSPPPF